MAPQLPPLVVLAHVSSPLQLEAGHHQSGLRLLTGRGLGSPALALVALHLHCSSDSHCGTGTARGVDQIGLTGSSPLPGGALPGGALPRPRPPVKSLHGDTHLRRRRDREKTEWHRPNNTYALCTPSSREAHETERYRRNNTFYQSLWDNQRVGHVHKFISTRVLTLGVSYPQTKP